MILAKETGGQGYRWPIGEDTTFEQKKTKVVVICGRAISEKRAGAQRFSVPTTDVLLLCSREMDGLCAHGLSMKQ